MAVTVHAGGEGRVRVWCGGRKEEEGEGRRRLER